MNLTSRWREKQGLNEPHAVLSRPIASRPTNYFSELLSLKMSL